MQKVKLTTEDGVELTGLWWDTGGTRSVLLLHMMPSTKESWIPLAEKLAENGLNVLAIDFRGHGESGGGDYKNFSAEEHQQYVLDAVECLKFLKLKYPDTEIVLAGASIGANVCLRLQVRNDLLQRSVLLSPGVNYHGIRGGELAEQLGHTPYEPDVLVVSSRDDAGNLDESASIVDKLNGRGSLVSYDTGGHGTDLFVSHPELLETVKSFLTS